MGTELFAQIHAYLYNTNTHAKCKGQDGNNTWKLSKFSLQQESAERKPST